VFTTAGAGVHPDHHAVTAIVVNGVFYARLPKWDAVPEGEVLTERVRMKLNGCSSGTA
jgi:LmbE family N-acetylglucosaminyl deacetylase